MLLLSTKNALSSHSYGPNWKWVFVYLLWFLPTELIEAQTTYYNNTTLTIESGATLYMGGDFVNQSSGEVSNSGTLDVDGDWTNNGNAQVEGTVVLNGSSAQNLAGNTSFQDLDIDNSNGVTISSGTDSVEGTLSLTDGVFTTNDALIIKSDNSETGLINDFSGGMSGSLSGEIKMQRYIASPTDGFHSVGSAVATPTVTSDLIGFSISGPDNAQVVASSGCDPNNVDPSSPYGGLFEWHEDGPFPTSCVQSGWYVRSAGQLSESRGYTARIENAAKVIQFQGTANTGNTSYDSLSHTNATGDGYHLVCNPYPSPITWVAPSGFDSQAHFWQSSGYYGGTYQTILSGAGVRIPSSQAFFVRVGSGTHDFDLANSDRSTGTPQTFYRTSGWYDQILELKVEAGGFADKTTIYFKNEATADWDSQMEAHKMESLPNQPTLYTKIENDDHLISINALANLQTAHTVPMGLIPGLDGSFEIVVDRLEGFPPSTLVFLEDRNTGLTQDLVANPEYNFTATASDNHDRFNIHFFPPAQVSITKADCDGANGSIEIDFGMNTLIRDELKWDNVNIVDSEGNQVFSKTDVNGIHQVNNLNSGVYFLEMEMDGYISEIQVEVESATAVHAQYSIANHNLQIGETLALHNESCGAEEYAWNFGDGSFIDYSENPIHSYSTEGTYEVSLTAYNAECEETVSTQVSISGSTTGILDDPAELDFALFFFEQTLTVRFNVPTHEVLSLKFFGVEGRKIFETAIASGTTEYNHEMMSGKTGALSSGYYVAHFQGKTYQRTQPISIIR